MQNDVCIAHGAAFDPPAPPARLGVALGTLAAVPLHGMRVPPHGDACGWYIWAGDLSDAPDFFQPLCVDHVPARCPLAARFLALPPGWRFQTDGFHVDVWYDDALLRSA